MKDVGGLKMRELIKKLQAEARELIKDIKPSGDEGFDKYLDSDSEVKRKVNIAVKIGLNLCNSKKILDISTGCGWFPWVLRRMGHEIIYTDNLNERCTLSIQVRKALELNDCIDFVYKKTHQRERTDNSTIWPYRPLPDLGNFDIIAACSVTPHTFFDKASWHAFIGDALLRLHYKGFLYIAPNVSSGWNELRKVVESYRSTKALQGWKIYDYYHN